MCDEKKIMDDVKESVEELDKAAEEAAEAVSDAVEEAADKTADALDEPISNIEKTVGDLKKKIEEITEKKDEDEDDGKKFTIPDFSLNDDQKERIAEFKENAAAKVDAVKDKVTDKVAEIRENVDVDKTVAILRENAVKAVDGAKKMYGDLKEDPRFQQAAETAKNAKDKAVDFLDDHISDETQEKIKDNYEKAKKAAGAGYNTVKEKVSETVTKENVKTFTGKVAETVNKGIAALKGLFAKK